MEVREQAAAAVGLDDLAAETPRSGVAKLPRRVALGWGAGEWAGSTVYALFSTFFLFFMTDVVGIGAGTAGTIVLIVTIFAGVVTLPVGVWTDGVKWRSGRRRPFLLIASVPLAVAVWLMFTDWGLGSTATFAYLTAMGCLWALFYAMQQVPLTALAAEMTPDYDERSRLVSYRSAWSQAAYIAASVAALPLAGWFGERLGSDAWGWSAMVGVLALTCVPAVLWAWGATRGRELYPENTNNGLREMWRATSRNRSFHFAAATFVGAYAGAGIAYAITVYFMSYQLGLDDNQMALAFLIVNVVGLVAIPFIERLAVHVGKRAGLLITELVAAAGFLGFLACDPSRMWLFWVLQGVWGATLAGAIIFTWAVIPDVTEVDEYRSGQRREGLFYSVVTLLQMLATAFAVWLVGVILGQAGYDPDAETLTDSAMWAIRIIMAVGPAVFALFVGLMAILQPMTKAKHSALTDALARKKAGETGIDESAFADLL
jgi:GPH family glycoside/pentoside/hexuronide:cation symporter/oligogalacturonide transporter